MAKRWTKQLFKKIIVSFFPKTDFAWGMNATGMFVSFISTKQFFSLVNRKIVENYKLNLFDIALDPFEVKIWFGETPGIKVKEIDDYYGYCSTANLNGYRFFSPWTMATTIAIVMSMYVQEMFHSKDNKYFLHFLYTVYLLSFVFVSRLKKFPYQTKQENFQWFIEVFFNFYQYTFTKTKSTLNQKTFQKYKALLLKQTQLFFCFFYFYQKLNHVFDDTISHEAYSWLFYDEIKKSESKAIIKDFLQHANEYTIQETFSTTEQILIDHILPADLLIRYLFIKDDELLIARHLVPKIFKKEKIDVFLDSFLENDDSLEAFLEHITNFRHFRENFFDGAKEYTRFKFRMNEGYNFDQEEEINEFMSSVEDVDNLDGVKIPEKLRAESDVMEKLLNFYITFVGGLWISRGDNFFVRVFRKPIMNALITQENLIGHKQDNLYYFGGLLYTYSKNIFYYKYAFDNIREGKDKFVLPFKSKFKEVYSNMFIVKMLDENFVATLLQDTNHEDIKIYVKAHATIDTFKKKYGKKISQLVRLSHDELIQSVYGDIQTLVGPELPWLQTLTEWLQESDLTRLKDHFYHLDFWFTQRTWQMLTWLAKPFSQTYSELVILWILATLRDTFFGFVLYMYFLKEKKKLKKEHRRLIALIYFTDVVNVHEEFFDELFVMVEKITKEFKDFLSDRVYFDDNSVFLHLGFRNRQKFVQEKSDDTIINDIAGEDIIRFRGYLKNITFYNKRYIHPA